LDRRKVGLTLSVWVFVFLVAVFGAALNVPVVKASGTIYIREDGSIDPPTTPIMSVDNVTYIFIRSIYDSIVVQRNNIVVDGRGYTVEGTGNGNGIDLSGRGNVTVKNMQIKSFLTGIYLFYSSNNVIIGNNITNNARGIYTYESSNNTIHLNNIEEQTLMEAIWIQNSRNNRVYGNNIKNNPHGLMLWATSNNTVAGNNIESNTGENILLYESSRNTIYANNILNSEIGIYLSGSSNNLIYHNNFVNNTYQAFIDYSANTWDDGYPSGGNYWSDYTDVDFFCGPYQNITESDGIWDHPYFLDANNRDNYPLTESWTQLIGDIDGDWDVDSNDLCTFSRAYGTRLGEPNYQARADLERDGDVEVFDLYILARNYGKTMP